MKRPGLALLATVAVALVAAACAVVRVPVLPTLRDAPQRDPVILIPGLTGTVLTDRDSGRTIWGVGNRLLFPRDGGYEVALPVGTAATGTRIEATAPLYGMRLFGVVNFEAYRGLPRLMEANGYQLGDLEAPRPDDTFFFFVYDWRRDTVELAQQLVDQLENLRRVRGEPALRVSLITQSGAARIARYLVRFGGATLEEAEGGRGGLPRGIEVEKVVFVGTPHGGAMRTLALLQRGRRYLPFGRRFQPEVFLTFPALFQDLPAPGAGLFLDATGAPVSLDLYDPSVWQRLGWGFFNRTIEQRLQQAEPSSAFGDAAARERFLARQLDRARRLHRLLGDAAGPEPGPAYYSIQSAQLPTPARAVLVQSEVRWQTLFQYDKRVRRDPYLALMTSAPGDGHATLESQGALSAAEEAWLAAPTAFVDDRHFRMIRDPGVQQRLLEFLSR